MGAVENSYFTAYEKLLFSFVAPFFFMLTQKEILLIVNYYEQLLVKYPNAKNLDQTVNLWRSRLV